MIRDNAYDSHRLDTEMDFCGIEVIVPIDETEGIRPKAHVGRMIVDGVENGEALRGRRTFVAWSSDKERHPGNFSPDA